MLAKKTIQAFSVFLVAAALTSCASLEQPAAIEDAAEYQSGALSFSMPGNWQVEHDLEQNGLRQIVIASVGGARIRLLELPGVYSLPLEEKLSLDREALEERVGPDAIGDSRFETVNLETPQGKLQGIRHHYTLSKSSDPTPQVSDNYQLKYADATLYVSSEASLRTLPLVQAGFDQIIATITR